VLLQKRNVFRRLIAEKGEKKDDFSRPTAFANHFVNTSSRKGTLKQHGWIHWETFLWILQFQSNIF